MAVQAVFVVFFMFATSVKATTVKGGAEFSRKEVTLTCPGNGAWYEGQPTTPKPTILPIDSAGTISKYTFTYERPVLYRCEIKDKDIYYFYIKGRACENCFELDPKLFVTTIVVDVIATAVLMMIIYRCSKKKSSDGPTPSVKPTPRAGHRAPHGPSEYETLNPNTRSQDTYSTVVNSGMVNRTG